MDLFVDMMEKMTAMLDELNDTLQGSIATMEEANRKQTEAIKALGVSDE